MLLDARFQARAHEWLFSSEEGQWMVVESSKAARLIMVYFLQEYIFLEDLCYCDSLF